MNQGNLRELVHVKMKEENLRNPTIRYREVGHFQMRSNQEISVEDIELVRRNYQAADGDEIFLSFENSDLDIIFGFLRLRHPSGNAYRPEISSKKSPGTSL